MDKSHKNSTSSKNQAYDDTIEQAEHLDSGAEEDEWEDYIPEPPDGGWGWVIMIASFFNNFILDGISYCFGVFLDEYVNYFQSSVSSTSLANSLLCGIYLLVGPIVGALVNKYGCRVVGFAGSLTSATAFILSTFSPGVVVLQLTYGIMGGCGFGMMYLPAVVGVGFYFEKKRALATGIAVCGTGIGTFALAPIGRLLLANFDWKNAHIILAGLILQGCVFSALMRPLTARRRKKKGANKNKDLGVEEEKGLVEQRANGNNCRKRTTSRTSNHVMGSKLVLSDSNTPASILHASAFLQTNDAPVGSGVDIHNLSRPLYRKDIFYSGSVMNVHHDKSDISLKSYVASITSIPNQNADRLACLNYLPKPIADILAEMLDLKILKSKGMMLLCFANLFGMLGFYVPIVFTANRAVLHGVDETNAALLLSIMGICNTVGRVLSGCMSLIPNVPPLLINNICVTLAGVAVLVTPFCTTFWSMALSIAAYGLFASTFISLASIILCDLVGLEKLTNGFGLLCLVRGITAIAGPPLEGKLFDMTGNYDATFYAGGACIILSGILHFLLHLPMFKRPEVDKQ